MRSVTSVWKHPSRFFFCGLLACALALPPGAVQAANSSQNTPSGLSSAVSGASEGDIITVTGDITLTAAIAAPTVNVTVKSDGTPRTITMSGTSARGFSAPSVAGKTLTLDNIIVQGMQRTATTATGAGIYSTANGGNIALQNGAQVVNNTAGSSGGGIATGIGSVTVTDSTVSGNIAGSNNNNTGSGAGINTESGNVTVTRGVISGNEVVWGANANPTSQRSGGGISTASGIVTVTDSTVTGNKARHTGGGISASGAASMTIAANSGATLFSGNLAGARGGAVFMGSAGAQGLSTLYLDSGTGSVTFSGNYQGVSSSYATAGATANAIFLGRINASDSSSSNMALAISGSGTLDLRDPVQVDLNNGKSFSMTQDGSGLFKWGGANIFDAQGGSSVALNGLTELYNGFSLTTTLDGGLVSLSVADSAKLQLLGAATFTNTKLNLGRGSLIVGSGQSLTMGPDSIISLELSTLDPNTPVLKLNGGSFTADDARVTAHWSGGTAPAASRYLVVDGIFNGDLTALNSTTVLVELDSSIAGELWLNATYGYFPDVQNVVNLPADPSSPVLGTAFGRNLASAYDRASPNGKLAYQGLRDIVARRYLTQKQALIMAEQLSRLTPEGSVTQGLHGMTAHNAAAGTALGYAFADSPQGSVASFSPLAFQSPTHGLALDSNAASRRTQSIATARMADRLSESLAGFEAAAANAAESQSLLAAWRPASASTRAALPSGSLPGLGASQGAGADYYGVKAWGGYFGNYAHQDSKGGYAGYNAEHNGLLLGASVDINANWTTGLYAGYTHGQNRYNGIGTAIETSATHAGAFVRFSQSGFKVTADGAYSYTDNDSTRSVHLSGGTERMQGSFNQNIYGGGLELAYDWRLPFDEATILTPFAAGRYSRMEQDGYSENGSLGLNVHGSDAESLTTSLGFAVGRDFSMDKKVIMTPRLSAAWLHQWADDHVSARSSFVGSPVTFMARSVEQDKDAAQLGLSVDMVLQKGKGWDFGVKAAYGADIRDSSIDQTIFGGVEFRF